VFADKPTNLNDIKQNVA